MRATPWPRSGFAAGDTLSARHADVPHHRLRRLRARRARRRRDHAACADVRSGDAGAGDRARAPRLRCSRCRRCWSRCSTKRPRSGRDVSSFRRIMSGGAMVAPELVSRMRASCSAPTSRSSTARPNARPVITMAGHDDSLADLTGTIGQPLPNIDVAILDPHDRRGRARSASRARSAPAAITS